MPGGRHDPVCDPLQLLADAYVEAPSQLHHAEQQYRIGYSIEDAQPDTEWSNGGVPQHPKTVLAKGEAKMQHGSRFRCDHMMGAVEPPASASKCVAQKPLVMLEQRDQATGENQTLELKTANYVITYNVGNRIPIMTS